jgi:hypothetical protein
VALLIEVVVDLRMNGGEFLQGLHSPEAVHRPLSSSEGQVTVLHPVIGPSADLVLTGVASA